MYSDCFLQKFQRYCQIWVGTCYFSSEIHLICAHFGAFHAISWLRKGFSGERPVRSVVKGRVVLRVGLFPIVCKDYLTQKMCPKRHNAAQSHCRSGYTVILRHTLFSCSSFTGYHIHNIPSYKWFQMFGTKTKHGKSCLHNMLNIIKLQSCIFQFTKINK